MNKAVRRKPAVVRRHAKRGGPGNEVGFSWDRMAGDLVPEPLNMAIELLSRGVRLADNLIEIGHQVETKLRRNLDRLSERLEELRM